MIRNYTIIHRGKLRFKVPSSFAKKQGIKYFKNNVFCTFNVDRRQAYTFLVDHNSDYTIKDYKSKRLNNNSN